MTNTANSYDMTESGFYNYHVLRVANSRFGKMPMDLSSIEMAQVKAQAQREYDLEATVLATPEAAKVIVADVVIEAALDRVKAQYEVYDDFIADLERNDLDLDLYRASLHRELRVDSVLEHVGSRMADISDVDVMIYYYMHKEKLYHPETRTAHHILITINDDYAENRREQSFQRLEKILERVRNKPKRFEEQALKHSECPTAMQGGLLGKVVKGKLYPQLEEELFKLKQGEISNVIETELGLHILYCKEIRPEGHLTLKEAAPAIKEKLTKRRRRMCQRSWLTELKHS